MWSTNVKASWSSLPPSEKYIARVPTISTSSRLLKAVSHQRAGREQARLSPARCGCRARAQADTASLYDRLGGKEPVKAASNLLFDKLIEDPELGHYFERTTLGAHKLIVAQFLAAAFGGPKEYKGRSMVDAHVGLPGFEHPKHFNIVATCLQDTLNELNIPKDLADEVMSVAASLEPDFARVAQVRKVIDGM